MTTQFPDHRRSARDLLNELHQLRSEPKTPDWDNCAAAQWLPEHIAAKENRMLELRTELATREHVPGVAEGKAIRRERALANRGHGKSKNR